MSISYPPASAKVAGSVNVTQVALQFNPLPILAANTNRCAGTLIINNCPNPLSIFLGTTDATLNGSTNIVIPGGGGTYDLPSSYYGAISGVTTSPGGNVKIVEPTA